jgi:peroxiredoxin
MFRKIISILLIIIVITLGYIYLAKDNKEVSNTENTINKEEKKSNNDKEVNIVEIGKPAPDFTLTDLNDEDVTLSDFKGKKVLLNFWATWCPYCVKEMPDLNKLYNENKEDLVVIGIDVGEDIKTVNKFLKENNVDYPIVFDVNGRAALKYNAHISLPISYIIDEEGIVKGSQLGMMNYEQMKSFIER